MNWVVMLEWVTKWKYGYWELLMSEQISRRKRGIICPGKVTADVSSTPWVICVKESTLNSVSSTSGSFLPHLPPNTWALNFKIYSGENCFAMELITLKFSLLKILVIFLNTNFDISSQPDNWNLVSQCVLKIHFTLQIELFLNNREDLFV